MAREFAQIRLTIWGDHDFTNLSPEQQLVYLMLSSQPTINLAGVLDYLPGRLARLSNGLTARTVDRIVEQLEGREFVFRDAETDEILVRSMVRTSGAWKAPTVAKSIAANVEQTLSPKLKSVLLAELNRVTSEAAAAGQWEKAAAILRGVSETLSHTGITPWRKGMAKGIGEGTAKGMGGEGEGEGDGTRGEGERNGAIEPIAETGTATAFDQWWQHWPKKTSKGDARKAFPKALRAAGLAALIEGAGRYTAWVDRNRVEDQFVVGPGRWLREERWTDELTDRQQQPQSRTTSRIDGSLSLIERLEQETPWTSPTLPESSPPRQLSPLPSHPTTNASYGHGTP